MGVIETFSKRMNRALGRAEVYQFETIPPPLRIQIRNLWLQAFGYAYRSGPSRAKVANSFWRLVRDNLAHDRGVDTLFDGVDPWDDCCAFLLNAPTIDCLDIIEYVFGMGSHVRESPGAVDELEQFGATRTAEDVTDELNIRFKEHGVGYQLVNRQIVRMDSVFLHTEAVERAIRLLAAPGFEGASEEFLQAHEHFRHGRIKDAMTWATKAFESTMKAICDQRGWPYSKGDTARPLLGILMKNGLVPNSLESHFDALRTAMESGLPTIANREARHGQGSQKKDVADSMAALALHYCAANIVFLVEAHNESKP